MAERKRIDDMADVSNAAIDALAKALSDGDGAHPPGSWRQEPYANHINHLQRHMHRLLTPDPDDEEDHLSHLICRAVMAYAVRASRKHSAG